MTGRKQVHPKERRQHRKRAYVGHKVPKHERKDIPEPTYLKQLRQWQAKIEREQMAKGRKLNEACRARKQAVSP